MKAEGNSTSTTNDESYKQRMITFHIELAPSEVISVAMNVYDRSFVDNKAVCSPPLSFYQSI